VGIALVAAWVAWRGRHPDPELFSIPLASLQGAMQVDRAPLPEGLAGQGWQEGPVARFDSDNLYAKINGREGFYKSFGFQELIFVSLALVGEPMTTVDIELFDQGTAANALGCYAGERPAEIEAMSDDNGMFHRDRNALYITRGRYYIRAIGADESAAVLQQLAHLQDVFVRNMQGDDWPWAFALFVDGMQTAPGDLSFQEENAFSFGFAHNVWAAAWEGFELFAIPNDNAESATKLADRFASGFLDLGERVETANAASGVPWVRDRYLSAISGARASGRWVLGVRGAPTVAAANAALSALEQAVSDLPEDVLAAAWASVDAAKTRSEPGSEPSAENESIQDEY
jgi:hypothetical protein